MKLHSKGPSIFVSIFVMILLGVVNYVWYKNYKRNLVYQIERPPQKSLGFIRSITEGASFQVEFDDALWLTGREAEDAAIRLGVCTEGSRSECTPNGYLITNTNQETVAIFLAPEAQIEMVTYRTGEPDDGPESITPGEFASLINNSALPWNSVPYHVTLQNSRIIKIEEQYIP